MNTANVSVLVTGNTWMGNGVRSIGSVLWELFDSAESEILGAVYAISGGADPIIGMVERALFRGVRVRLVVNRLSDQPVGVGKRLRAFVDRFQHFDLYDFNDDDNDLHCKVFSFDAQFAVVGSANLSHRGLVLNHELGVLIEGDAVYDINRPIDVLIGSSKVRSLRDNR